MPHIVATITDHGLGHLSISAPILNELHTQLPDLKLTLISGLPEARLRSRISAPYKYQHSDLDFGMHNDARLSVVINDTAEAYRALHDNWPQKVEDYVGELVRLNTDFVFSNVSYLSLAAASAAGIPNLGLSPLNWASMYQHFCGQAQDFERIQGQMLEAYRAADVFLLPTPSMPMPELNNAQPVGPIAAIGRDNKRHICKALETEPTTTLALVAMGGHDITFPVTWPQHESIHWLVTRAWGRNQPNVATVEDLKIPFLDLLASCDLIITKPGYGVFTEATCAGKPVLFVRRPDWPEESCLIRWLEQNNRCKELSLSDLGNGRFIDDVIELVNHHPIASPSTPTGVGQVIDHIVRLLR